VTLPEILVVVVILGVVVGSVTAIYGAAMRTWYQGATLTYAEQKASWVVERMAPDLRAGTSVVPASHPYDAVCIAVRQPAKTFDGGTGVYLNQVATDAAGAPYLVQGDWVVYYRGDEQGNLALDGDRVWRVHTTAGGATLKRQELVDNIVDNPDDGTGSPKAMFVYWPDVYHLRSVEMTITVEETRGHRTSQATMNSEMALRNN
jgi:hypothetical protein